MIRKNGFLLTGDDATDIARIFNIVDM